MGYLLIKDLTKDKIQIRDTLHSYQLSYVTDVVKLLGICFTLTNISISKTIDEYKIYLMGESLDIMNRINENISQRIKNYKSLIKHDEDGWYLSFNVSNKVNRILKNYKDITELSINIYKIKKYALNNVPIVYILI